MSAIVLTFFAALGVLTIWLSVGPSYWLIVPVALWSLLVLVAESLEGDDDKQRRLDFVRRHKR